MKHFFSLAAAAALATASLSAQAQVTLDGVINANEIGAANAGRYISLGRFTSVSNFGNWGLLQMYGANTSTKLHLALAGTMEKGNGNNFQFIIDLPNVTGLPQGTTQPDILGSGTVWDQGGGGAGGGAKFDMPVDMIIALEGSSSGDMLAQAAIYTSATAAVAQDLAPTFPGTGAVGTISAATTSGAYSRLAGMRMAYRDSPSGDLAQNPGTNNGGGAGAFGWEVELDRTALGLPSGASIVRVFGAYVSADGFWSNNVIPEVPGRTTNFEQNPDFTALSGTQAATLNVVVLSNRKAAESVVAMSVFPNPVSSETKVTYQVANGTQNVQVILTDLMGRTVRVLHDGAQSAGFHDLRLNAGNVAAGTYMVKVQVGDMVATRKVAL